MANPVPDARASVATYLASVGALSLTAGSNLFVCDEIPAETAPGVYVRGAGGPAPEPYFGSGGSDHILQLSLLVRGQREREPEGFAVARAVADALQKAVISPFYSVLLRQSQPFYIGRDDHDAPGWSIGLECRFTS